MASDGELAVGRNVYYLSTTSPGGTCKAYASAGKTELVCSDGASEASADSERGCLDSRGAGYCARDVPHTAGVSGSELTCPSGESYVLHSGVRLDNRCLLDGQLKKCKSGTSGAYALASCDDGCGNTGGPGFCCKADTSGCGFAEMLKEVQKK